MILWRAIQNLRTKDKNLIPIPAQWVEQIHTAP